MKTKAYLKKQIKLNTSHLRHRKKLYIDNVNVKRARPDVTNDCAYDKKLFISTDYLKIISLLLCLVIVLEITYIAKTISAYWDEVPGANKKFDPNLSPDYALASAGAMILGQPSAHQYDSRLLKLGLLTLVHWSVTPELTKPSSILMPLRSPGECWAFTGSKATTFIRLSHTIIPLAVTIDHIPREISPSGHIASALKLFSIYAAEEEGISGDHLGTFTYQSDGEATQTFLLLHLSIPVNIIQFTIHSNHGHHLYTCVYKIRIHGNVHYI